MTDHRSLAARFGTPLYVYDLDDVVKNHENYVAGGPVAASNDVKRMLRPALDLVPIAG